MITSILRFSIERRWLVLSLIFLLLGAGVWSFQQLPIDAVPDITNVQVQINTDAPGYSPLETEQRITYPVENALAGLPNLDYTRSISRYGLSQVTVVFHDGTDPYFARNLINERLGTIQSSLPPGLEPDIHVHGLGIAWRRSGKRRTIRPHRTARDPGLDHQTSARARSGSCGDQQHWGLQQAIPRDALASEAAGL
jgi:Cu/Ag efflux pump CusA